VQSVHIRDSRAVSFRGLKIAAKAKIESQHPVTGNNSGKTGKNRVTVWPFFREGFQRKTPDIQTKN
jgi:hypothetical protein